MEPGDSPTTIDEAELLGWEALHVTCPCHVALLSWTFLRSRQCYRRLDEIRERLRCAECGREPTAVALFRRFAAHPRAAPQPVKQAI